MEKLAISSVSSYVEVYVKFRIYDDRTLLDNNTIRHQRSQSVSPTPPATLIMVHHLALYLLYIYIYYSDQLQTTSAPGGVVFRYTIIPYSIFNRLRSISISYECYRSYTRVINLIRLVSIGYDRVNLNILIT